MRGKYQIWQLRPKSEGGDVMLDAVDHRSYLFDRANWHAWRLGIAGKPQPKIEYRHRDTGRQLQPGE